jgi:hypothetical protein
MKRWLISKSLMVVLAVPIAAQAQTRDSLSTQTRDTTYITRQQTDTTYVTQQQRDTTYVSKPTRDTTYVATSTTSTTYAEKTDHEYQEQTGFEVKGGLSFGNVSNRGVLPGELKARNGWAAGVAFHGASPVGFGIEALWAQRGVNNAGLPAGDLNARELDYIDVPAYLRLSVPFNFQPFVYAGPQASFEIRCRAGTFACPDTDRPTTSWNAVIGAGLRIAHGAAFSLEGRYVYGLTDLHLSTITSSESYRTRSFLLLLGVGI